MKQCQLTIPGVVYAGPGSVEKSVKYYSEKRRSPSFSLRIKAFAAQVLRNESKKFALL